MRNNKLLIISIFLISTTFLYAQSDDFKKVENITALKNELANTSEITNTLSSSFKQEKHLWMLEEIIISEGIFLFKKPGNVLWQYNSPVSYTISIFDNTFTIDNDGKISKFDINSNPLFQEINKMIVTAIRGDFINNPEFISTFSENKSFILAKLLPQNPNVRSMITSIDIYFGKSDYQVSKVVFHEPGDDFTSIVFSDSKVNIEISDKEFIITEPK